MTEAKQGGSQSLKQRAIEEFKLYWVIAIYFGVMIAAFTWYRRFVLSSVGIGYFHYGAAVIEALILAKVILIGEALKVGRRFENSRLVVSTLFKSLTFGIFIGIFGMLEHLVENLVHGEGLDQSLHNLFSGGRPEILARTVMLVVALVPFFAFWEADRVMGDHQLFKMFFRKARS